MKDNFNFLNRKIWFTEPNIDKSKYFSAVKKDKYGGFIYYYKETEENYKKRIQNKIKTLN